MTDIVAVLKGERDALRKKLSGIEQALVALGDEAVTEIKRERKALSASAKRKISQAQKLRWKVKKAGNAAKAALKK